MGPMQMKLLNEIEKSMRLKENGMNIASVVTLQEACVEAARDVNEYISPLCDATVHITIGVLRYVADLLEEEGGLDESGQEMAKKVQEALHSSTTVEAYKYKEEKK